MCFHFSKHLTSQKVTHLGSNKKQGGLEEGRLYYTRFFKWWQSHRKFVSFLLLTSTKIFGIDIQAFWNSTLCGSSSGAILCRLGRDRCLFLKYGHSSSLLSMFAAPSRVSRLLFVLGPTIFLSNITKHLHKSKLKFCYSNERKTYYSSQKFTKEFFFSFNFGRVALIDMYTLKSAFGKIQNTI